MRHIAIKNPPAPHSLDQPWLWCSGQLFNPLSTEILLEFTQHSKKWFAVVKNVVEGNDGLRQNGSIKLKKIKKSIDQIDNIQVLNVFVWVIDLMSFIHYLRHWRHWLKLHDQLTLAVVRLNQPISWSSSHRSHLYTRDLEVDVRVIIFLSLITREETTVC